MTAEIIASIYLNRGFRGLEEWLGVNIKLTDVDIPGCLVKTDSGWEIVINRNLPEWMILKVLFHEIYHLKNPISIQNRGLYQYIEQKANKFAWEALKICQGKF
jgi:hypothetical protein